MKSLLSIIGVLAFEEAAARATRRAAKATLAVGGSYLGMIDGELVRVEAKSSADQKVVSVDEGHAANVARVIRVATPTTKSGITRALRAEKVPTPYVACPKQRNIKKSCVSK